MKAERFIGCSGAARRLIAKASAGCAVLSKGFACRVALVVLPGAMLFLGLIGVQAGETAGNVPAPIAPVPVAAGRVLAERPPVTGQPADTNTAAPAITGEYGADGLRMNFHGAPLNLVLEYLSDAAGFVINKQAEIRGAVEVWSKQSITKEEAVELLSSVLKKNGYALTRNGRILTIVGSDNVKTADTEIVVGSNPNEVEKSDEVQTQIIPVRYANASQLVQNLQLLLPTSATLSVNESANTLIVVATRTDIKRVLRIVNALDSSMTSAATIKVLPLRYADAKETASLITQLYSQQQNSTQTSQAGPGNNFDAPGGGPFGGSPPGMGQASSASSSTGRGSLAGRVVAVADDRSNSVILSATPDLLGAISGMVGKLDQQFSELTELRVFRLTNAEPSELADQLAQLFPDETNSGNNQNNNMPFFFPGGGGPPGAADSAASGAAGERAKKTGKVLAVADARTASLIVTAAKTLMPQIEGMIAELDSNAGRREVVSYFELRNADPQDIYQNLQDLFNRNTARSQSDNQNSFLGRNNPLTQRQTQNQQATGSSSASTSGLGAQSGAAGARPGQ